MKIGKLIILFIIALALCILAIVAWQKQHTTGARQTKEIIEAGDPLLPTLPDNVGDIARITFQKEGKEIVLTCGDSNDWTIETIGGYPANQKKIRQLIFELTEIRVADALTAREEKYSEFGLAGEAGEGGTIVLADSKGKPIRTVLLGTERARPDSPDAPMMGGGRYFRLSRDPHVYLAEENLYWLDTDTDTWADTDLVSVSRDDVAWVDVDHVTTPSQSYRLVETNGSYAIPDLPDDMKMKTSEASAVAGALSSVRMTNVLKTDSDIADALKFNVAYKAKTRQGTAYAVKEAHKGDDYYVTLSAEYDEPLFSDQDHASTESLAAARKAADAAKDAVPVFNERHSPWVYQVQEWTARNLVKERKDLIEPKPKPKEEAPAEVKEETEPAQAQQ